MKSGSTATVALVRQNKIIIANVGDSRGVLCRNGRAIDLTTEHRVMGHVHLSSECSPYVDTRCQGASVSSEIERVKATGGWIDDGRVCGLLAVSRAFGDWELKGNGLNVFLQESITSRATVHSMSFRSDTCFFRDGFVTEDFASKVQFTSDPLVCTPDVTEMDLIEGDQFVIVATDGLWYGTVLSV